MIKEAMVHLQGLFAPNFYKHSEDVVYTDRDVKELMPRLPETIQANTLRGVVDYVLGDFNDKLYERGTFIHVWSDREVRLTMSEGRRLWYPIKATLPTPNTWRWGEWMKQEDFIIQVKANFLAEESTRNLLRWISNVVEQEGFESKDSGVTQSVLKRSGVGVDETMIPEFFYLELNDWWPELRPPKTTCFLRIRKGPMLMLKDVAQPDASTVRKQAIAEYLRAKIPVLKIPILL